MERGQIGQQGMATGRPLEVLKQCLTSKNRTLLDLEGLYPSFWVNNLIKP